MLKILFLLLMITGTFCFVKYSIAEETPKNQGEEPEGGDCCTASKTGKIECTELAKTMKEIDKNYKEIKAISGYTTFGEKDWNVIHESSKELIKHTKKVINEFPRPENSKYQELNNTLLAEAEILLEVAHFKKEVGAVEDAQWQIRNIRHTCASCHKHLGLHIYPNLYPKEEKK